MQLNRTRRLFYGLTLLWVFMLLGLGSWWLFLVFKLHNTLSNLGLPNLATQENFLNMIKWEGSFFFIFLWLLGATLLLMYFKDMKKTKALQAFFSSLSHELRTPLASMRLQVEVIKDLIGDENHSHDQLSKLAARLVQDSAKLESELEKSLQLSRIEEDNNLTLTAISLGTYLKRHQQKLASQLYLNLMINEGAYEVLANELALNVIFRNLFENTIRHNPTSKTVNISAIKSGHLVELTYDDQGLKFKGNTGRLGKLFYKFNSAKGTGVGLYLIKNLMRKMHGNLEITNTETLKMKLTFRTPQAESDV